MQSRRTRADRAASGRRCLDQRHGTEIRDRPSRIASALDQSCSAEARAAYIAGAGVVKDQLEEIVADESLALIDHYRIVRGGLYIGFGTASEIGDRSSLAILVGRLHENFRDCGRLTGELREMRCRYAEMVAVGEHRESDTTITVWDDEKNAWRSIHSPGLPSSASMASGSRSDPKV